MNGAPTFVSPRPGGYTQDQVAQVLAGGAHSHVLVQTSGSTGTPRTVAVSGRALHESGAATARFLGATGQWLLALPTDHIAGIQVLARSELAGHRAAAVDLSAGFTARAFLDAHARLSASHTLVSLVPTQLFRLLDSPAATAALATFAAILLGGAAAPQPLLDRAAALGLRIVTTYGMSETAGGCVYNGRPLDAVTIKTEEPGSPSRILISGPMLASGYLADGELIEPADSFVTDRAGVRWHRTNDLGQLDAEGRLSVLGRADDTIISGGANVSPTQVESLLTGRFGFAQVCVVGVPDQAWGQRVIAVVIADCAVSEIGSLTSVRRYAADNLGRSASPTEIIVVPEFPLTASGKVDRRALAEQITAEFSQRTQHET